VADRLRPWARLYLLAHRLQSFSAVLTVLQVKWRKFVLRLKYEKYAEVGARVQVGLCHGGTSIRPP
jgi:hypothetical protein